MTTFLAALFIIICLLLIIVILLQKGRGAGLGGAFGGIGSSAFGTRTGDVFTWVTIILVALFLLLAVAALRVFTPTPTPVDTPTFVPPPGPISKTIRVSIQCRTPKARIFYTLDGSEPTKESIEYDGATVPVRPGQTLKARAFLRGWKDSKVAVGVYADAAALKPTTTTAPTTTTPTTSTAPAARSTGPAK